MRTSKHTRNNRSDGRAFVKLAAIAALVYFASGCETVRTEYRCPFGPANADVVDEELDGKLDAAPATLQRLIDIDFECGFDSE